MNKLLPNLTMLSVMGAFLLMFSSTASAASPDGAGPWADSVVTSSQGTIKNGGSVPLIRSDATQALGVAEDTTVEGTFFSLGFGGSITLEFDNTVSGGIIAVEATNPGYPNETAQVEVSADGITWVTAGSVTTDGQVSMPSQVPCAKFVRLTDTSNPENFSEETADGYDVDGVRTLDGTPCEPPGGGGNSGSSTVIINKSSTCTVSQTTVTNVQNSILNKANTGKNKIKNTVGGVNSIASGMAKAKTKVTVLGGNNTATGCGCCHNGNINVVIGAN